MPVNFPGSLDNGTTLPNPAAGQDTNSPSLSSGQTNQNSAIIAVETKVGTGASVAAANEVLLGNGAGTSAWGQLSSSYFASVTGTGAAVFATSPTLASPTLNTPVINNPTLLTDSVVGFTTSNTGTLYGISVTSGAFSSAISMTSTLAVTGAVSLASTLSVTGQPRFQPTTALPASGNAGDGILLSSTSNFGIFYGSGAPTFSAAQGSIYLRSDGSSTSTRLYVNTNGSTGWTNVTTAA